MTGTEGGEAGVSRTSLRSDWPSGTSSAPSIRLFMKEGTLEGKHLDQHARALVRHLEAGRGMAPSIFGPGLAPRGPVAVMARSSRWQGLF